MNFLQHWPGGFAFDSPCNDLIIGCCWWLPAQQTMYFVFRASVQQQKHAEGGTGTMDSVITNIFLSGRHPIIVRLQCKLNWGSQDLSANLTSFRRLGEFEKHLLYIIHSAAEDIMLIAAQKLFMLFMDNCGCSALYSVIIIYFLWLYRNSDLNWSN